MTGTGQPTTPEIPILSNPNDSKMWFAYTGIFVVAIGCIGVDSQKFLEMWNWQAAVVRGSPYFTLFVVRLVFFVELLVWTYRWIHATAAEADLWVDYLDYRRAPREALGAMCALALFLGITLGFADRVVVISLFFTTSLLLNYYTQWFCNTEFAKALVNAKARHSEDARRMRILAAMKKFWIDQHQLGRITIMIFVSSLAFALALAGAVQQDPQRIHFQVAAYVVLIVLILVSEAVIFFWRHELHDEIDRACSSEG